MPLPAWALGILTGGVSVIKDSIGRWLTHKQQVKLLKQQRKLRRLEAEIEWNTAQVQAGQTSWKDEYIVVVLSIPMIMCFIPGLVEYVERGFEALAKTPPWYQAAIGVMIAAVFGYRKYADWTMRKKLRWIVTGKQAQE